MVDLDIGVVTRADPAKQLQDALLAIGDRGVGLFGGHRHADRVGIGKFGVIHDLERDLLAADRRPETIEQHGVCRSEVHGVVGNHLAQLAMIDLSDECVAGAFVELVEIRDRELVVVMLAVVVLDGEDLDPDARIGGEPR